MSVEKTRDPGANLEKEMQEARRFLTHKALRSELLRFQHDEGGVIVLSDESVHRIEELLEQDPVFFEDKEWLKPEIVLDPEFQARLQERFFENIPNITEWIEQQPSTDKRLYAPNDRLDDHAQRTISNTAVWQDEVDYGRVRVVAVPLRDGFSDEVISKRLNPKKEDWKEVERARSAYEKGLPTPRVLGTIFDHGNMYVWFEHIPSLNLVQLKERFHLREPLKNTEETYNAAEPFLKPEQKEAAHTLLENALHWSFFDKGRDKLDSVIEKIIPKMLNWENPNLHQFDDPFVTDSKKLLAVLEQAEYSVLQTHQQEDWFQKLLTFYPGWTPQQLVRFYVSRAHLVSYRIKLVDIGEGSLFTGDFVEKHPHFSVKDLPPTPKRESSYKFVNQFQAMLFQSVLGEPEPYDALQRLEKMSQDAGIPRGKYVEERDVLVRWDKKMDKPIHGEDGKAQYLLVDWEEPRR